MANKFEFTIIWFPSLWFLSPARDEHVGSLSIQSYLLEGMYNLNVDFHKQTNRRLDQATLDLHCALFRTWGIMWSLGELG